MTEETKNLLETIKSEVNETISEKQKGLVSTEEMEAKLNAIHSEIKGIKDEDSINAAKEQANRLEASLKEQGEALQALKEQGGNASKKSFKESIYDSLNTDLYKSFSKSGHGNVNVYKAVGDMSSGGNLSGTYPVILPDRRQEPLGILDRPLFMRDILNVGTTIKDKVDFVKESGREGAPAPATEVATSAQIDFNLVESVALVERIAAHLIVSRNMLDDIPYLSNLISRSGINRLLTVEDTQILSGTGTTPQLQGIIGAASAFAAGSFANAVAAAQNIDVIRVAIENLTKLYYRPTYVVLHPTDVATMDLEKDSDGQYVMFGARYDSGTPSVWGVPVFVTTAITAGTYLLGDFTNGVELLDRRSLEVSMTDSHASIFTSNQVAIRLEERIALPIYRSDAFITGTFSTDIAAITA